MFASAGGLGLYARFLEPHWIRYARRSLPIEGLPTELDGSLLVQMSDLHVGPEVDSDYLIGALKTVKSFEPHIVVFTGDFITYRSDSVLNELSRVLRFWPRGRIATLAVLGNHDYGRAWNEPKVAAEVARRASDAGIQVLRNGSVEIKGLKVVGMDDLWGRQFDPASALAVGGKNGARIVLCHNPDGVDRPGWDGYSGWVLSGHTHGGQCKPPFLTPPRLPVRNKRYSSGEIDLYDGRRLYINSGLGHLMKVRFNVRPEVTLFRLSRA
jgi:hypothetical protein